MNLVNGAWKKEPFGKEKKRETAQGEDLSTFKGNSQGRDLSIFEDRSHQTKRW